MRPRALKVTIVNAAVCLTLAATASTAGASPASAAARPIGDWPAFQGLFSGTAYGDRGTQAPLSLELSQQGTDVVATATLGDGLYVGTRFCGGATVQGISVDGTGYIDPDAPATVRTLASFDVQGIPLRMAIKGDLSEDGQTLAAETTLHLPALCGPNPVLTGTLERVDRGVNRG